MLVITRPVGQGINVDVDGERTRIEVKVLGIRGNQVRIGIEAPQSVRITKADDVDVKKDVERA